MFRESGWRSSLVTGLILALLGTAVPADASYFNPVKRLRKRMDDKARQSTEVESPEPQQPRPPGPGHIPPMRPPVRPGMKPPQPAKVPPRPGPSRTKTPAQKPLPRAVVPVVNGMVRIIQGSVTFKARLSKNWQPLVAGASLEDGDSIQTGPPGSAVEMVFVDGTTMRLDPFTKVALQGGSRSVVKLFMGRLIARFGPSEKGILGVQTPTALIRGRGSETFISLEGDDTIVAVTQGNAAVSAAKGKGITVAEGQFTAVPPEGSPAAPRDLKYLEERTGTTGPALVPKIVLVDQDPQAYLRGLQTVEIVGFLLRPVEYVEFSVNGVVEFVANVPPYRFNLDTRTLPNGPHVLGATVFWADRGKIATNELKIQVYNGDASPSGQP